jgi:hypothetical protein
MLHVLMKLEVFIEICTFRHGNKYALKKFNWDYPSGRKGVFQLGIFVFQ